MKTMTGQEIRQAFLDFFGQRDHRVVKSYALVPPDDPTLYFVNAGMVQFKDVFVGARTVDYSRAASCQKCLRVSGKHNDLENVGRTARHHTFFEMLGNFSFGDYFKREAITYAWEFITEVVGLPAGELFVTVHPDDDEARGIWREVVGLPAERVLDDPENFWQMADTGPCGPCSEIHIDLGKEFSGGEELPFGHEDADDRYMELWNLVFMQFDRSADGELSPLPAPSIDTGAGLERMARVLQGKPSNYETDLFMPVIELAAKRAGVTYREGQGGETDVALRVIADHSRSAAFLIADGVYPDNEGRGYVLRRIMRRAIRFGRIIGLTEPFLVDTTARVVEQFGEHYPELVDGADTIRRIVLNEEKRFGRTINAGIKRLDEEIATLKEADETELDGRVAFELYDTHGFPPDLTALIAADHGITVDEAGFDEAMEEQRERARAASKFGTLDTEAYERLVEAGITTEFTGYTTERDTSEVVALLAEGERVPRAAAGQRIEIVTRKTPMYAESGGQVGDRGTLRTEDGTVVAIDDVQKPFGDLIVHFGTVEQGQLSEGDAVSLEVDVEARNATRKNHSATHLLHYALRTVLGDHVRQRGSLVAPDRLRFDFSHTGGMTAGEIREVELLVNRLVLVNEPVQTAVMAMDDALAAGAIAFFEEKYGDDVRVLRVGSKSIELCGGTHVAATGDIGLFKILGESAISSGVRRLEAVTGMNAVRWAQDSDRVVGQLAEHLHVGRDQVVERVGKLLDERKELAGELEQARTQAKVAEAENELKSSLQEVGGFKFGAYHFPDLGGKELRSVAERLRDQIPSGALMVSGSAGDKVSLVIAATKDAAKKLHAGKLVGELAPLVGGRGGGRPDMAQAGGSDSTGVARLEPSFFKLVRQALGDSEE